MRSGVYQIKGEVVDVAGEMVLLNGEYHVLASHGGPDQTGLTRRVRGEMQVNSSVTGSPSTRIVGSMQPYQPDHVVRTADLRPISIPVGFGFVQESLPNAEIDVLRFAANYWFEHLGDHLQEIRLMGERGRDTPIPGLQSGSGERARYALAALVDDGARALQTDSPFWRSHIGRIDRVARESGILNRFDFAIKRLDGINVPAETDGPFRQQLDQARRILWRIPAAPVVP